MNNSALPILLLGLLGSQCGWGGGCGCGWGGYPYGGGPWRGGCGFNSCCGFGGFDGFDGFGGGCWGCRPTCYYRPHCRSWCGW